MYREEFSFSDGDYVLVIVMVLRFLSLLTRRLKDRQVLGIRFSFDRLAIQTQHCYLNFSQIIVKGTELRLKEVNEILVGIIKTRVFK